MASDPNITECQRCGTCCQKGGPALHLSDKPLIDEGIIPAKHLYTLRKGELARDPFSEKLTELNTELIKIKGQGDTWTCRFLKIDEVQCRIYTHRPVECRVLKCWDTRKIQDLYFKNRLARIDVLGRIDGLWDLVNEHQNNCSFNTVLDFIKGIRQTGTKDPHLEKKARYVIRYDLEIRSLITRKKKIDPAILDFLFGRPVIDAAAPLGLKIRHQQDKIILTIGP